MFSFNNNYNLWPVNDDHASHRLCRAVSERFVECIKVDALRFLIVAEKYGSGPPNECEGPSDPNGLPRSKLEDWFTKDIFEVSRLNFQNLSEDLGPVSILESWLGSYALLPLFIRVIHNRCQILP